MSWRRFPITQVDAFADRPFAGNPAAVMPLGEWLADDVLQAIAAENNLAETAFLIPDESGEADYELRWFTPGVEVALCGHATLASGHVLLSAAPWRDDMRFRTRKAGILRVARDGDEGYKMALPAYPPATKSMPDIAKAMGGMTEESDPYINQLFARKLESHDATKGFILDGYPATKHHADFLAKRSKEGK